MNTISPKIELTQGELNFLSMDGSFVEQAGIAACGRQFVQQMLLFLQNTEIEFASLAIVETIHNVALLTRKLESCVGMGRRGGGFAKLPRAFVAARFEHHPRVLVLEHLAWRKTLRHCAAPIGEMLRERGFRFRKIGFGS